MRSPGGRTPGHACLVSSLVSSPRCGACCPDRRSVCGEAVEQAGAAGRAQVGLAAAAFRAARGMRGVPGLRWLVVAQALAVDVSEHRGALRALGPVAAGAILACRAGAAV